MREKKKLSPDCFFNIWVILVENNRKKYLEETSSSPLLSDSYHNKGLKVSNLYLADGCTSCPQNPLVLEISLYAMKLMWENISHCPYFGEVLLRLYKNLTFCNRSSTVLGGWGSFLHFSSVFFKSFEDLPCFKSCLLYS